MTPDFPKPEPPQKWYFKTRTLVIALLIAGPFALPLLWFNPRYKVFHKIVWTVILLALTYASGIVMEKSVNSLKDYYGLLTELTQTQLQPQTQQTPP